MVTVKGRASELLPGALAPATDTGECPRPIPVVPPVGPDVRLSPGGSPTVFLFITPETFFGPVSQHHSRAASIVIIPARADIEEEAAAMADEAETYDLPEAIYSSTTVYFAIYK